jgi:AcrR family transcriptional regulator
MVLYAGFVAVKITKKPKGSYHHPDLEQALVDAAIRTIGKRSVESLTLRDIGTQLGVSRTAIYRHFEDKSALLARVALEGFRMFRLTLQAALDEARERGVEPIEEMGVAYLGFAMANESHYKTMFGDVFEAHDCYPDLNEEGGAAFEVLLNTVKEEQQAGRIAATQDPLRLAHVLWAAVHGIALLGMSGRLTGTSGSGATLEELSRLHSQIVLTGLRTQRRRRS